MTASRLDTLVGAPAKTKLDQPVVRHGDRPPQDVCPHCRRPEVVHPGGVYCPLPVQREWEIWSEGFRATGESATAQLLGRATASTFEEACRQLGEDASRVSSRDSDQLAQVTNYGYRLFPSEAEARQSFG